MQKSLLIGCWILFVVSSVHPIRAEENLITVAATEWSPYISEKLPNNGLVAEITRVAFERAGYKAVFKARFPYLLESQASIQFLLSTPMFTEAERNSIAFYETPVEIDKNYTVFSKKAVQQKPFLQAAFTAFDASLAQIKADGAYAKILRDYGM